MLWIKPWRFLVSKHYAHVIVFIIFCTFTSLLQSLSSPEPTILESSGRTLFSEYAQRIYFAFSTNQICQIWREVRESRAPGVGPGQSSRSLPQVKKIVGSGNDNVLKPKSLVSLATQTQPQAQPQAIGTTQVKKEFDTNTSSSKIIRTFRPFENCLGPR